MTTMIKDHILAALPTLSRPDLEQVQAMAASLLGGRLSNADKPGTPLAAPLFQALSGAVNGAMTLKMLSGTAVGKSYEKRLPAVTKFLDAHFAGWDDNKLEQTAFLNMLMGLLRDDLKARGVTPTVGMMISNLLRLPEVFDNAYPQYLEARMGSVILNQFKKVRLPSKTPMARKKPRRISV